MHFSPKAAERNPMSHPACRGAASRRRLRSLRTAVALGVAGLWALAAGAQGVSPQATASRAATAPTSAQATGATTQNTSQTPAGKSTTAAAGKPVAKASARRTAKNSKAQPKGPVAVKNVAVGADAVPALPKAFLSAGCLDARHGEWLSGGLGASGGDWLGRADAPATEGGPVPEAALVRCVPFAAVRSPSDRIESLAFMPAATPAEMRRVMLVSRPDQEGLPATSWHDLAEAPAGYREAWMPAAAVLSGDLAEQVPPRWQRDVMVLVRQMKKQAQAADSAWVRLVVEGEGDAARVVAVELVDEDSGQAIDSALWLDRPDAPGGFVSARGGDHERMLWQSPVDYRRISRGVGAASVIVRRRVMAQPKTPGGKPRMVVRSFRTRGQHQGVDYAAPTGTPVVTVADGTVVHAGRSGGYGNLVVVDHGGGITTYYAHLSAYGAGVQEGTKVERGQEIGQVGSTGMSTGPHLHFEIRRDGRYLDPADPVQSLPNWGLGADEHRLALTRLLALQLSRQAAFTRAARPPEMASAPASAAAE